ncbi:hypothetical protein V6x_06510 [Gimesia chilikensis]|uniref:Uncharacterized protein n=1 Tax=Gimesia chilikensis TaxID=2605989 RepID=A0A517W6V7_9PLAN|nr:hypothetical protein V6x_06510 [Gimesia chilikensis]
MFPLEVLLMLKVNRRADTWVLPYMIGNRIRVRSVSSPQSVSCSLRSVQILFGALDSVSGMALATGSGVRVTPCYRRLAPCRP